MNINNYLNLKFKCLNLEHLKIKDLVMIEGVTRVVEDLDRFRILHEKEIFLRQAISS